MSTLLETESNRLDKLQAQTRCKLANCPKCVQSYYKARLKLLERWAKEAHQKQRQLDIAKLEEDAREFHVCDQEDVPDVGLSAKVLPSETWEKNTRKTT